MIYIEKIGEPKWLTEFKRKYPHAIYTSKEFEPYRGKLRETLLKEQRYLCAYCCARIDMEHAHNEHMEPQNPRRN